MSRDSNFATRRVLLAISTAIAFSSSGHAAPSAYGQELEGMAPNHHLGFGPSDTDADGIGDDADNCIETPNADQRDTDADGFGNACDPDLNNDCIVNAGDLGLMKSVFFTAAVVADLNGDGAVDFLDLGTMRALFSMAPGPSGIYNICDGGDLQVDFEDDGGPYELLDFAGAVTTVLDNPHPTGINTSPRVVRMQKFAGEVFAGSTLVIDVYVVTDSSSTMKVWSQRPVDVLIKLEGLFPAEVETAHSGTGWEELTFDFPGVRGVFFGITVIFDLGVVGDAGGDPDNWTFYFDDIALEDRSPFRSSKRTFCVKKTLRARSRQEFRLAQRC